MAYAPPTHTGDPTAVMGRRIGAWIIDFIPAIILGVIFSRHSSTTYTNVGSGFCDLYRSQHSGHFCFQSGTTAYTSQFGGAGLLVQLVYWFANAGLLQGATGATLGKQVVGLRVVDRGGNLCGMGKAVIRTIIGYFELGFCFLIGLITALVSKNHRRLGDMAADTYVVRAESVGVPITGAAPGGYPPPGYPPSWGASQAPPGTWTPPPAGQQQWGGAGRAPGWVTPPPAAGPPPAGAWGQPPVASPGHWAPGATPAPEEPTVPAPAATPTPAPEPAPTDASSRDPEAPDWGAPAGSEPPQAAPQPAVSTPVEPAAAPPPPQREPQWDSQRNAWVYWEAETNRWLQFDPTTNQWGPLR